MFRKSAKAQLVFTIIKLVVYVVFPITLIILPKDFFDHGQSISLFELLGVEEYYSKGMTKAVMHLIHLDFEVAWSYNKLAFIVLPLISYLWFVGFLREAKKYEQLTSTQPTKKDLKFGNIYRFFRV